MPGISTLHTAMPETADGVICLPPGLLDRVRHYRLERVRRELRKRRVPAIVLYDPVNIRYATDTRTSGSAANGSKHGCWPRETARIRGCRNAARR
jgi:hypothetical protein